jgi:hypothetical protein
MLLSRIGAGIALGAALAAGTTPALAAAGWAVVAVPPTGQNASLAGVASTSDSNAWAVGSTGGEPNGVGAKPLLDQWNGTAWSQVAAPATPGFNTASLAAVSASGPADAWAVGRQQNNRSDFTPLALHWNGTAWSVSPSAATALAGQIGDGVTDISRTDAYAIGGGLGSASTGLVARWNGTAWTRVTVPAPSDDGLASNLTAISADGPDNVWIVGTYSDEISPTFVPTETYSLHWNGSTWAVVPMPLVGSSNVNEEFVFNAIQANGPDDVWAVGSRFNAARANRSKTLIEHFNGTSWSIVASPSPGTGAALNGVTTSNPANDVWAVGSDLNTATDQTRTLTLRWNGTAWATVASADVSGTSNVLTSAATAPGASIVQAVGYTGTLGADNPLSLQHT